VIIHRVSVSGFRIIGSPITIQFPEQGRIGIFGQNESGKSTLLESIEYALYGLKRGGGPGESREDVVAWGKPKARLVLEFTSGENRYLIEREIGSRRGHQARLYVMIDGRRELISRRITEIEQEVERITGMDRNTFTKLVYVKQKDLDALKELTKASREQLVNRVMGMEVFDKSVADIREDVKELEAKRSQVEIEFQNVNKNKEAYEDKVKRRDSLVEENKKIKRKLGMKKNELDAKKSLLEKYEWLNKKNSNEALLKEMNESLRKDEESINELNDLKEQIKAQTEVLDKYKPEMENLKALAENYRQIENSIARLENEIKNRETEKDEEIARSNLSAREIKDLTPDLPAKKTKWMTCFLAYLLGGLGLLTLSFLYSPYIAPLSIALLITSIFSFRTYRRLDRVSVLYITMQAISSDIEKKRQNLEAASESLSQLKEKEGYESAKEIEQKTEEITSKVKSQTGADSITGLEELLKNNRRRAEKLEEKNLEAKIEETQERIAETKANLNELEIRKPDGVDELTYTEANYEEAKKKAEEAQQEYNKLKEEYDGNKGEIKVLNDDINRLKKDYDRFPILKDNLESLKREIDVRRRVVLEIKETSRELRGKVLPYAEFIINEILPTITDGRYSDLEITEDLKFKAHSMEAGEYKEREVFSGGTQDQFLIALRLAFTRSILDSRVKADHYSLLMDECISSSDETRKQGIFEVLDLMKKTFQQIFIIAHEDISDMVDHHLVLERNDEGYTEIRSKSW
jgi:exonuclease SbcC